jgi:Contractile injection system tape measure protein
MEIYTTPIPICNAGLVVLQAYVPVFFERLGLVQDELLKNITNQSMAAQYLYYLCAGAAAVEGNDIALNNILCGLPPTHPLKHGFTITPTNIQLTEALINAAKAHWLAIGDTSVEGFRKNWLVRNGTLIEQENKFELIVEKRAYDILLHQFPFSFSIIKYQWMDKPVQVNWV